MTPRQGWWRIGSGIALVAIAMAAWVLGQERAHRDQTAQETRQREITLTERALSERTQVAAALLAESLVNPTYFFDLQRIGEVLVSSRSRGDVAYVMLLDANGRILHDGSADIARYGQLPDDPLAAAAIASKDVSVFAGERFTEVAHPITLGDQRLATLRLAFARDPALMPAALPERDTAIAEATLLACLALAFAGLLWLGDRRLAMPQAQTAARLAQLARLYGTAGSAGGTSVALDGISARFAGFDQELKQQGLIDGLTALPNRIALRATIDEWMQRARAADSEFALLFIDLDDFKRINDTLGHDVGDDILSGISRRFSEILHEEHPAGQGYIARFGGDEFVVLLDSIVLPNHALHVARKINAALGPISEAQLAAQRGIKRMNGIPLEDPNSYESSFS